MERLKAIRELAKHDHAILSVEVAHRLAAPFGVTVSPQNFEVGQGRVVSGPEGRWTGVSAHRLAHRIAASLGLREGQDYPEQTGIGSQLRVACEAVEQYLESQQ